MNIRWGPKGRNECGAHLGDHPVNHCSQDACWVVGLRQQVGENLRESKAEERGKSVRGRVTSVCSAVHCFCSAKSHEGVP